MLRADFARNPRLESNYAVGPKSQLWVDMFANGFRDDKPLVVNLRDDGFLWVLQGHRRFKVVEELAKLDPERFELIPCLIYKGLTLSEEQEKVVDHFGVKLLNEFEVYQAIKSLKMTSNLSEDRIAQLIGKSRGYVQRRLWVATLPKVVEAEWKKKVQADKDDENVVNITDKALTALSTANTLDKSKGQASRAGGPEFAKVWENLVKYGTPEGTVKPSKVMEKKMIEQMRDMLENDELSQLLQWVLGDPVKTQDIDNAVTRLREKAQLWDDHVAAQAEKEAKKENGKKKTG